MRAEGDAEQLGGGADDRRRLQSARPRLRLAVADHRLRLRRPVPARRPPPTRPTPRRFLLLDHIQLLLPTSAYAKQPTLLTSCWSIDW